MDNSQKEEIKGYLKQQGDDCSQLLEHAFSDKESESDMYDIAHEYWEELDSNDSSDSVDLHKTLTSTHKVIAQSTRNKRLEIFKTTLYRIAAVLVLPLLLTSILLWTNNRRQSETFTELSAPRGSRIQFVLPDGSTGYLNGGSSLKYKSNFIGNRTLALAGECYLNVEKDKKHPFVVETNTAKIKVLGTRFDVCAYSEDFEQTTTLEEGSVLITNKLTNSEVRLKPGQQSTINSATGRMSVTDVDTDLYTSWTSEMLKLDNTPFSDVMKKLERWYGVRINVDKQVLRSESYTMTIKTESLRELLDLLSITTPMSYKIENNTVQIDTKKGNSKNSNGKEGR